MRVINTTKDKIIASEVSKATTFWQRLVGLLAIKELKSGQGLIISPCKMIHTFFMRFPLDIIFLGPEEEVIKTIENMNPNSISPLVSEAEKVIELKVGAVSEADVEVGDHILLLDK